MSSFANDRSRKPAGRTGAAQNRAVRFKARCPRCRKRVHLGATEISQLGVRLHSQVHCPICQHQFILSLTPGAPPPDERPRDSQMDAFVASEPAAAVLPEGPRKAKLPFKPLIEPEQEVSAAPPKPQNRVVPFAPLPENDAPMTPGRYEANGSDTGKTWSPGRWWKGLPDRKQKMVLGVVIGLFAVVVFGWTVLQSAAGPAVETTAEAPAPTSQATAGASKPATEPEAPLLIEDDLSLPAIATGGPVSAPLVVPPPAQAVSMPDINRFPPSAPAPAMRPSGS
jgi:hypothetical protein